MAVGNASLGTIRGSIKIDYDGAGVARANKDLNGLGKTGKTSAASFNQAGTIMLAAGAAIAGGFALAVNSAANFEKGLSNIRAVSGATAAQMELIRKKALQLGADTKFSAGEAASAIEELVKAGLTVEDALNGAADATVNLAAAGDIALPEAATIAANAMNQFALSAKQLPQVADLIAGAANASAIDIRQFGFSLSQVGAVAHLAGVSFADTAAAIALLGNAGIVGSDAGTSLKSFLSNLIPTTKQQIELSKQLGLLTKSGTNAFFDQNGKVKSLAEVSQVLQNATKNLTKEQKLNALQILFGSDAIRAAAVLADQGAAGFTNMADAMAKVKAADVAKTKMDNLKGSIEQLKGSLETAGIVLGTILIPPLRRVVDAITKVANAFTQLSPKTQRTVLTILGIAAAILLFVGVVFKIIQVIKVFQTVWIALNVSFIATPIGAIITAIVLLIGVIIFLAVKTRFFQTIWNAVWGFLKTIGAWFAGPFANFFVELWKKITNIFNAVANFFQAIWRQIVGFFTFYFNIIKGVIEFFAPLFRAVFGLITSIVRTAFSIIGAIIAIGVAIWRATIEPVIRVIAAIIEFVIGKIVENWRRSWNLISGVISAVWNFVNGVVTAAVTKLNSIVIPIVTAIVNFIQNNWFRVRDATSTIWNGITSFFSGVWNFIVGIFRSAVNNITGIINGIKAFVDRVRQFFDGLKNAASGGVGSLISFVAGIPGRVIGAIGNLGSSLFQKGRDLIQGFINGIAGMAGRIRSAIISILPGPLRQFASFLGLASPSKLFRQWGVFTIQGFINGLIAMRNRLKTTMGEMAAAASIPTAYVGVLGVSPSTGLSAGPKTPPTPPSTPPISVTPQVVVVADFGDGVRRAVRSTVTDDPRLIADASARGEQDRRFLAPARG